MQTLESSTDKYGAGHARIVPSIRNNIFLPGIDDSFYTEGCLCKPISPSRVLSVFIAIIMTAVAGLGLVFEPRKKPLWLLRIYTVIIVLLFLALVAYLFSEK